MVLGKASTVSFFINRSNFENYGRFGSENMSFVVMFPTAERRQTIGIVTAAQPGVLIGQVLCAGLCESNIVANPEFCVFISFPNRGVLKHVPFSIRFAL